VVAPPAGGEQAQIPLGGNANPPDISGAPLPPGQKVLSREERVEYRDQDGNLLDEEQVKALQGKVEFKTRYETRMRVVDAQGNEIPEPAGGWPQEAVNPAEGAPEGVAPPHPDVEGVDRETKIDPKKLVPDDPIPAAKRSVEGQKEKEGKSAKPASEGNEATGQQAA